MTLWIIIFVIGIGSYAIRFSFIGLVGDRPMPDWVARYLRYAAVAVMPGLVAPAVLWPQATDGAPDTARICAALATLAVGFWTKNVFAGIGAGAVTLYSLLWLL